MLADCRYIKYDGTNYILIPLDANKEPVVLSGDTFIHKFVYEQQTKWVEIFSNWYRLDDIIIIYNNGNDICYKTHPSGHAVVTDMDCAPCVVGSIILNSDLTGLRHGTDLCVAVPEIQSIQYSDEGIYVNDTFIPMYADRINRAEKNRILYESFILQR